MSVALEILIPVRNGFDQFQLLAKDLIRANPKQSLRVRLNIIDDASTDSRIQSLLATLETHCLLPIRLYKNKTRKGFIGSVNKVARHTHPSADLLILNSDTRLDFSILPRMKKTLYEGNTTASVTPLSNRHVVNIGCGRKMGTAINWPFDHFEINKTLSKILPPAPYYIPSGLGFCLMIRRAAWEEAGPFLKKLGFGYLDDIEWSIRTSLTGWSHALASNCYVPHFGSASFGMERKVLIQKNFSVVQGRHKFLLDYLAAHNDPNFVFARWKSLVAVSKHALGGRRGHLTVKRSRTLATTFLFYIEDKMLWAQSFVFKPDQIKTLIWDAKRAGLKIRESARSLPT